jgi:hypothetical protein
VLRGLRPKFPRHAPPPYVQLAQSCWNALPGARPTFDEVGSGGAGGAARHQCHRRPGAHAPRTPGGPGLRGAWGAGTARRPGGAIPAAPAWVPAGSASPWSSQAAARLAHAPCPTHPHWCAPADRASPPPRPATLARPTSSSTRSWWAWRTRRAAGARARTSTAAATLAGHLLPPCCPPACCPLPSAFCCCPCCCRLCAAGRADRLTHLHPPPPACVQQAASCLSGRRPAPLRPRPLRSSWRWRRSRRQQQRSRRDSRRGKWVRSAAGLSLPPPAPAMPCHAAPLAQSQS